MRKQHSVSLNFLALSAAVQLRNRWLLGRRRPARGQRRGLGMACRSILTVWGFVLGCSVSEIITAPSASVGVLTQDVWCIARKYYGTGKTESPKMRLQFSSRPYHMTPGGYRPSVSPNEFLRFLCSGHGLRPTASGLEAPAGESIT